MQDTVYRKECLTPGTMDEGGWQRKFAMTLGALFKMNKWSQLFMSAERMGVRMFRQLEQTERYEIFQKPQSSRESRWGWTVYQRKVQGRTQCGLKITCVSSLNKKIRCFAPEIGSSVDAGFWQTGLHPCQALELQSV